jgi:ribulose bisphosphate carboxylase small subunit
MAVVVGYEHVSAYLEDVQNFRARIKPTPEDYIREEASEDQVFTKLVEWLPQPPNNNYFRTIGYFRHMRNSFAHGHEAPSKEFAAFAAKHSHALNKFWDNGVTELYGLNFKNAPAKMLSADTAFAIMNLFRICLKEVDSMFASTISLDNIIGSVVDEIIARRPDLKSHPSKIVSKARSVVRMNYGESFPVSTVMQIVTSLLSD